MSGYYFADIVGDDDGAYDPGKEFGLCAYPCSYGRSGQFTFIVDAAAVVYAKDNGGRPVTVWPDVGAEGWIGPDR